MKLPHYIKLGYTPPKGFLGNCVIAQSDGCLVTANLVSLDASLVILMRVLRFEASGSRPHTLVRPMSSADQTHRSDRPNVAAPPSSVLALWINQGTSGFLVNHWKPLELIVPSANHHS
jgi:hypothetical protein